ncbi:N-acetylmuramoyl-L-alanine amidase [Streptomyces tubbatahanensis]|uniref:N-acetylmuramoyl-L-alanine amidase n=1 Tax=Streptomyces tubbatahanensis TaxID=2923272 RepID=A0ABY3XMY4_9ACTN|nr:N-acetylmuramoyl-L-alanine amidase [Streptomyces tubbatahanensis]UNS95801.1 N-acetylmuramoyl-L-alanine amidase [Streptomyces tubbatahanensis]
MPRPFRDSESTPDGRRPGRRDAGARRGRTVRSVAVPVVAAALVVPLLTAGTRAADRPADSLQAQFAAAADQYDVPENLLLGVSYLQSRWDAHRGAPSVSGGFGPMHLTDARAALAASGPRDHAGAQDARGDAARPPRSADEDSDAKAKRAQKAPKRLPARLRTLERAAELTGLSHDALRSSTAANVRGGAALLADAQHRLGHPLSADPADWYEAVAAFPGGGEGDPSATAFADDVFDVVRQGERRTTDTGETVTLDASPKLRAPAAADRSRTPHGKAECPRNVDCEWYPAPYEKFTNSSGEEDYGNHDRTRRPRSQKIDYIVIHDTEEVYERTLDLVTDPTYVSWQYTLRSSDGHIAQHVRNKDAAWHAGNWYVNSKSIGLEHEGFLTEPDAWFTESMYRSSARLVKYLAKKYDIPLDRQHVLGHDNVPATTTSGIKGMHTDPGPYWDWEHYFALLGKPFTPKGGPKSGVVTIRPSYDGNRPVFTGCASEGEPCPAHGSSAVRLHQAPDASSPLVNDVGLRPDGSPATTGVNDTGARATAGQQYAVADRKGEWTAIWYLGRKAWFRNPSDGPVAVPARGTLVEPREGRDEIPVYGRAYPEAEAYPEDVPVQALSPLPYKVAAGQRYVTGLRTPGEYLYAVEYDPEAEHFQVVRGKQKYYQIQLGHRVAFVKAEDVRLVR